MAGRNAQSTSEGILDGMRMIDMSFSSARPEAPHALGEHTFEVLLAMGVDQAAIDKLLAPGVAVEYPKGR